MLGSMVARSGHARRSMIERVHWNFTALIEGWLLSALLPGEGRCRGRWLAGSRLEPTSISQQRATLEAV